MVLLVAAVVVGGCESGDLPGDDLAQYSITGTVVWEDTEEGIEGADVKLSSVAEEKDTTTDENGNFKFADLDEGRYDIEVTHDDYDIEKSREVLLSGDHETVRIEIPIPDYEVESAEDLKEALDDETVNKIYITEDINLSADEEYIVDRDLEILLENNEITGQLVIDAEDSNVSIGNGNVEDLKVDAIGGNSLLLGDIGANNIEMNAENGRINIDGESTIESLSVNNAATITGANRINNATINAEGVKLSGEPGETDGDYDPEYAMVTSVEDIDDIEAKEGTSEDEVLDMLPEEIELIDELEVAHEVELDWKIEDYNRFEPGNYTASGEFELPAGVLKNPDLDNYVEVNIELYASEGRHNVFFEFINENDEEITNLNNLTVTFNDEELDNAVAVNVEPGEYNYEIDSPVYKNKSGKVTVENEDITEEVILEEDFDTNMNLGKEFVEDLGDNTAALAEVGVQQTEFIEESFREEIAPYSMVVFKRVNYTGAIMANWLDSEETIFDELENNGDGELVWEYQGDRISIPGDNDREHAITITATDLDELIIDEVENGEREKLEINLSDGVIFDYLHEVDNADFSWKFSFELFDSGETIEYIIKTEEFIDIEDLAEDLDLTEEEKAAIPDETTVILPLSSEIEILGAFEDDFADLNKVVINEEEKVVDFGKIELDAFLSLEEEVMNFNGQIDGDGILLSGGVTIVNSEWIDSEDNQVDLTPEKLLDIELLSFDSNTEFIVEDNFRVFGQMEIDFTQIDVEFYTDDGTEIIGYPMYNNIFFEGEYENLDDPFKFVGDFELDLDLSIYDEPIKEDEYIEVPPFKMDLSGEITEGEQPFDLEIVIEFEGEDTEDEAFEDYVDITHLYYGFGNGNYIEGTASHEEGVYSADLFNQYGQIIYLNNDEFVNDKVGEFRTAEGKKMADITETAEITFEFTDGTLITLFPEE